jgi:dipeptidyl aminopeptidase/acylaminoacyl peptidase
MNALKQPPRYTLGATTELVQEVFYEGEPFHAKPTRVFAYLGRPANRSAGRFPAMLLVHGGGGQAFREWAQMWAERGYVALAMDTAGQGPNRIRLPDGGPDQSDESKFQPFTDAEVRDMWTYHAVATVVRGGSLLASLPDVDASRIGITGISWGGYLTCIVSGIDDRLKVSVPVYGCGFLHEDSYWLPVFAKLGLEQSRRWVGDFDPSRYLGGVRCPILFVNGTADFAYPLDSYQKSYREVPGPVDLSITPTLKHSHQDGWAPKEIVLFVDSVVRQGTPLARVGRVRLSGETVSAPFQTSVPIAKAQLHFAKSEGVWQKRVWQSVDAEIVGQQITAPLPPVRPLVCFFTVTDLRDATNSSPHLVIPADK